MVGMVGGFLYGSIFVWCLGAWDGRCGLGMKEKRLEGKALLQKS